MITGKTHVLDLKTGIKYVNELEEYRNPSAVGVLCFGSMQKN